METVSRAVIMHRMPLAFAAVVLLAPVATHAQSITPVFRWPATATATIAIETRRAPEAAVTHSSGTMDVRPQGEVLVIRRPTTLPLSTDSIRTTSRRVAEATANLAYAVRRDGSFAGLVDTMALHTAAQQFIEESLQQVRARGANMPPEMVEQLINRFRASRQQDYPSVAFHTRARERAWQNLGHAVVGRSWSPGDSQLTITKDPLPGGGDFTTELHTITRYVGIAPCPSGITGTCWQFTTRSYTSPDSWRAALRAQAQSMAPSGMAVPEPTVVAPGGVTSAEIIVASETLLPLRVESRLETGAIRDRPATDSRTISTYIWKY